MLALTTNFPQAIDLQDVIIAMSEVIEIAEMHEVDPFGIDRRRLVVVRVIG